MGLPLGFRSRELLSASSVCLSLPPKRVSHLGWDRKAAEPAGVSAFTGPAGHRPGDAEKGHSPPSPQTPSRRRLPTRVTEGESGPVPPPRRQAALEMAAQCLQLQHFLLWLRTPHFLRPRPPNR